MPYKLRKAPNKSLYWVVSVDTGKKHSKEPIEKEKAEAQMRILMSAMKHEDPPSETIKMNRKDVIKEHVELLGVLKEGKSSELLKEAKKQEKELKSYTDPIISGVTKTTINSWSKKFEDENDYKTIKSAVLAIDCKKIDRKHIETLKTKEELLKYLRDHQCPTLKRLEAVMYKNF